MHSMLRSRVLVAVALIGAVSFSACKDEEEAEPDVDNVTLVVGTQTINISNNGTVTGGPITFTRPTAPGITATFKNAAGAMDPVAHNGSFQMNVTSSNVTLVTFTRTSAFVGTLTGVAAGSAQLTVSLFHIAEGHDDFGPFTVPITVN